jgi:Transposase DDE domain
MTSKSTRSKEQIYENINKRIRKIPLNKYAVQSGFKRRKQQKITGKSLLIAFFLMSVHGKNTLEQWAEHICKLTGKPVSRQGVWKRVNADLTNFLLLVLFDVMKRQAINNIRISSFSCGLGKYERILVQDSTVISLPSWLSWCFPGNVTKGQKKAQMKIQVVYDVLGNNFIHFEITPYTVNDQSKSSDILHIATGKDLVIRDLGYFAMDSFESMLKQNTHFVSRLRHRVNIYDVETKKEINLYKELQDNQFFDKWVILGLTKKVNVRLVAVKLPAEQAEYRRRKAKNNRDKRVKYSQQYLEMLDYNVFITSEPQSVFPAQTIARIYELRWRIENIFKCWKSYFHLEKMVPKNCSLSKERLETIIYMMLIFIVLFQMYIYNMAVVKAGKSDIYQISLSKVSIYISNNVEQLLNQDLDPLLKQILYYCKYDKRNDRVNFDQKLTLG